MAYNREEWKNRIMSRTDLCSQVTHLTKANGRLTVLEVLIKILRERKIVGSDPHKSFIVGDKSAVCFQDTPLYSICQNVNFELNRSKKDRNPLKYDGYGLMFSKDYVYEKGGRPVIYEKTSYAKKMLPEKEWWRIVNYDLSDPHNVIDWSHEREWRTHGDFEFDLEQATVLIRRANDFQTFVQKANQADPNIQTNVKSVVPLGAIFV